MRRPVRKVVYRVSGVLILATYLGSGLFQVRTDERGVIRRFGRVISENLAPGLHFHWPWPFERRDVLRTTEVKKVAVGFNLVDQILGEPPDALSTQMLTGDTNILTIQMMIHYVIVSPRSYLFSVENPAVVVRDAAESALTRAIAVHDVDWLLTVGRTQLQFDAVQQIQQLLDSYRAGVRVIAANLLAVEPPEEVSEAFKDVASAKIDREQLINKAESFANEMLPRARGEAERITQLATAQKFEQTSSAAGAADSFERLLAEYRKAPDITLTRMYLESVSEFLEHARIVMPPAGEALNLRLLADTEAAPKPGSEAVDGRRP